VQTKNLDNIEDVLAGWVKNIARIEGEVDPEKNLFQLGMDSLRSVQLLEMLTEHYGINMTLVEFSMSPVLKDLAKQIDLRLTQKFGLAEDSSNDLVEVII
jgi:acyl carrier protein